MYYIVYSGDFSYRRLLVNIELKIWYFYNF